MGLSKKQKEVLDFIKIFTKEQEISPTQREIKEHFGLKSYGSVQRYLKYLKEAGFLEQDWNSKRGLKILEQEPAQMPISDSYEIPLLGNVAAGEPIEAIENTSESLSIPKYMIPSAERHFALNVQGDSMIEDGILDGDIAICRQQETAKTGETVVAIVDNEATLKKFFKQKDHIELHPSNHRLSPIIVTPDQDLKVVGTLVALFRRYY